MIGYYVHHQGRGHLHRATAIATELGTPVTGLSSLERPADWRGDWVQLPCDDATAVIADPTASGRLHWVPLHEPGLRSRMAQLSAWIDAAQPRLIVVDVSVEVALLARLHGIPVIKVAMPGDRSDGPHALGYDISRAILAAWPPEAQGMIRGLSDDALRKLTPVGAISRFPQNGDSGSVPSSRRRGVLMLGDGGNNVTGDLIDSVRRQTPDWEWLVLSREHGTWVDDPSASIRSADVVVTHAGQNSIADVAAARRPAIVIPQERPHDEQHTTARVLAGPEWPALVCTDPVAADWSALMQQAAALDGSAWARWCDGEGAKRAAAVIERELPATSSEGRP